MMMMSIGVLKVLLVVMLMLSDDVCDDDNGGCFGNGDGWRQWQ